MLSVAKLNVAIQSVQILRNVSLELPTGSMTGLIGRNGAGKTTLMKSIMGLLKVSSGSIAFDSTDLVAAKTHARTRLGIGYMPEDRRLIPDLTAEENVLVPAWAAHVADAEARLEKVYGLIPELREFAPRKGSQLSGGQQKLVALGRALMCGTKLLLLDEPFEGVAPALAHRLVEVVVDLKREGMSVILSESDLQHSERMVDRIIVIDRGAITSGARPARRRQPLDQCAFAPAAIAMTSKQKNARSCGGRKTGTASGRRVLLLDRPGEVADLGQAEDVRDQQQNEYEHQGADRGCDRCVSAARLSICRRPHSHRPRQRVG